MKILTKKQKFPILFMKKWRYFLLSYFLVLLIKKI